ncbi:MAG: dual specificity protein phosphatase family protein [Sedimentisphaerales bacterium]
MTDNSQQEPEPITIRNTSWRVWILRILLVIVIAGLVIWLWKSVLEDRLIPKRWGVVQAGKIYRSGRLSAALVKKMLRENNISVIIDLTGDEPGDRDQEAEKGAAVELGIERLNFPLKGDGTGDINNYAQAIAAIVDAEQKGKPVLVHCAAGTQRTGGVIACYRMLVEKKPPSFAYAELLRYDWKDKPDQILLTYINSNMAKLAALLKEMGVIDEVPNPLPFIRSRHFQATSSLLEFKAAAVLVHICPTRLETLNAL